MKGKFMKLRKIVVPALVVLAMAAQLTGDCAMTNNVIDAIIDEPSMTIEMVIGEPTKVYAAENSYGIKSVSDFADYPTLQSHWGLNDINVLVSRGGIKGEENSDGTFSFHADREITTAELLSLILNTSGNAPTSTDWPMNVMEKAESLGLISSEWCNEGIANGAIPRERMASILYNTATKLLREDINSSDYDVDPEKVGDIVGNDYEFEIKGVYDFGLIAGDETGKFNPTGNTTRAESCAIINRLFKYTDRVDNSRLEYGNETPSSSSTIRTTSRIEGNVGYTGAVYPKEGDMFNGQPITRDPETGILGFGNGQKGGIYLGVQRPWADGSGKITTIAVGSVATETYETMHASDKYGEWQGYVYWGTEWQIIEQVAEKKLPKASAELVGKKYDIYGNPIADGDTTTPAYWICEPVLDIYHWAPQR